MAVLATLEACPRLSDILGCSPAAMRQLDSDLVAHKVAFVVFGDTFFGRITRIEFLITHMPLLLSFHLRVYSPQSHSQVCRELISCDLQGN
jgi:hypothetical protein